MENSEPKVVFTLSEVNQILTALGEIPAKHSFELVGFIRTKAQEQVAAAAKAEVVEEDKKD